MSLLRSILTFSYDKINHRYLVHDFSVKLFAVAQEKGDFHEDEEGSGQEGLIQTVQQRGSPLFKHAVAYELDDPGDDVDGQGHLPHGVLLFTYRN